MRAELPVYLLSGNHIEFPSIYVEDVGPVPLGFCVDAKDITVRGPLWLHLLGVGRRIPGEPLLEVERDLRGRVVLLMPTLDIG